MSLLEAIQLDETREAGVAAVRSAQIELKRRFAGVGCMARATDLALLFPSLEAECVEEALHQLCQEGVVEIDCLSDGTLAFHFPRR